MYVEWVLSTCESAFTFDPADDNASLTPNPVPRQLSFRCEELQHVPTAYGKNNSAAMLKWKRAPPTLYVVGDLNIMHPLILPECVSS